MSKKVSKTKHNVSINTVSGNIGITQSIQPNIIQINKSSGEEVIKIENNGDIYIKGKLITNDTDIVRYMKRISLSNHKENIKSEIRNNPELYNDIILELRKEKINKLLNK